MKIHASCVVLLAVLGWAWGEDTDRTDTRCAVLPVQAKLDAGGDVALEHFLQCLKCHPKSAINFNVGLYAKSLLDGNLGDSDPGRLAQVYEGVLQSQADLPLMQFALARVKEFSRDERSISLGPLCLTVLQQGPDGFIADERPEMRSMALGVLAAQLDRPPAETLPHLVAALNDPDDKVVHVAWDLLHGQGARALPYLVLGLDSSDSFIGSQCTELIRQLGLDGREAVPALLKRLDDPDWSTRWATVRALGEAGATDGAAVAGLRRAVADPHPSVSKEARAILDRIVKEHPEALVASAPKAGPLKIVLIVRSDGALDDVLPHAASTLNDGIVSRLRDIEASVEAVIVPGAPSYDDAALRILGKKHGAMAVAVLQPRFVNQKILARFGIVLTDEMPGVHAGGVYRATAESGLPAAAKDVARQAGDEIKRFGVAWAGQAVAATAVPAEPAVEDVVSSAQAPAMSPDAPRSVAVLDFTDSYGAVTQPGGKLAALVFAELATQAPSLVLLERVEMQKIMTEQNLSAAGLQSMGNAVAVGRMAGARYLVFGKIYNRDGTIYCNAKLVDCSKGTVKGSSSTSPEQEGWDAAVTTASVSIAKFIAEAIAAP